MKKPDTWIGLGLTAVALWALSMAWGFASVPGMRFGAWTFPVFVSLGLAGCGAVLTVKSLASGPAPADDPLQDEPRWTPRGAVGFLLIAGAPVFYMLVADRLGFLLTVGAIVLVLSGWFWRRPLACLVLAVLAAVLTELVFVAVFTAPLPRGLLSIMEILR